MEYIGLYTQIRRNNTYSALLLIAFPLLLALLTLAFLHILNGLSPDPETLTQVNSRYLHVLPFVAAATLLWFAIAYFGHSAMIRKATGARSLSRTENKRVYNLLENLCISRGLAMPKLYVINDQSLNAYASGINASSFAITLSSGLISKLNDEELEGVIAHELSHIMNRDVRLLIVSIVFVGIFAFVTEIALRSIRYSGRGNKKNGAAILVLIALAALGWFLSLMFRFAISQKREYMADAGAAELPKNPLALARALEKIALDPHIEAVKRDDVAQLFIQHPVDKKPSFFSRLFATHPPIEDRVRILKQF